MNLIAAHGFLNPKKSQPLIVFADGHGPLDKDRQPREDKDGAPRHPSSVQKGERFSIGGDLPLAKVSRDELGLIVLLQHCKVIESTEGDEGKAAVAKIEKELAQERRAQEENKLLMQRGSTADVTTQVVAVLASMGITGKTLGAKAKPDAVTA